MNKSFLYIFLLFHIGVAFNPADILKIALQNDDDDMDAFPASKILGTATGLLTSVLSDQGGSSDIRSPFDILKKFNSRMSSGESDKIGESRSPLDILKKLNSRLDSFESSLSKTRKLKEEKEEEIVKGLDGPHVCVQEVSMIEQEESSGQEIEDGCDLYREANVCKTTSLKGKTTKRIQYCCDGYTTKNIEEDGCLTEVSDVLLYTYNVSRTDVPANSTLLFTALESDSFILPGVQNSYDWSDKQILETSDNKKFVVTKTSDHHLTEIYLNCALKKETIRLDSSQILKLDGKLEPAAQSLLEIIETTPELSTFNKVLGAELRTFLREINTATVFAFTNAAFDALPDATKTQILNADGNDCVQDILKHHISTTGAFCSNLPRHVQSLNGETLSCRRNGSALHVDDALITSPSNYALNGVVHIIDTVLVRENFLSWRDSLRLFNTEMAAQLENETMTLPVTIFVPPTSSNDTDDYTDDVRNLLVSGKLVKNFEDVKSIHTDANSTIFTAPFSGVRSDSFSLRISMGFSSSAKNFRIGCSKLTASSIHACKAIIHFIDKPLPRVTGTVAQFLANRGDLSQFAKIWRHANFTIKPDEPVTVFAPTDDSFSTNLVKKIMRTEKSALQFVERHVVKEIICESDVRKESVRFIRPTAWRTMGGQMLTSTGDDEISGSHIEALELIQSDGVVHILESFIEPAALLDDDSRLSPRKVVDNPLNILSHLFG